MTSTKKLVTTPGKQIQTVNTDTFTSLINTESKFSFDEKHKISEFDGDSSVSKLAKVTTQALNDQVSKTQDVITNPSNEKPSSGPIGSSNPNEKLIAGRILAEARAASKGVSPTVNSINLATGAINELNNLKQASNIYQNASQTEKDGKVTDNMSTLIEGGQKVAQGVIDLMAPLLKGSPGVSIVGSDTINMGANKGISINSRGAINSITPQYNLNTSLNTTTSEVSIEKIGLKSQESETRINSTTNNIDKSTNNVQLHSSLETVSNNYTLYSKDLIQTVTSNKLDSFKRGETQGSDMKFSMDKTMLYSIGDTFTLGVGDSPGDQDKKPGFNVGALFDTVSGSSQGGSLLTINPSSYSLQQKGKVTVQSSGSQSNIGTKISNIASDKIANLSKQDVLSVALGTEFRIGSTTGFSTFMGVGSTVMGNFNIIGNLAGFISGIMEVAGLIFPDLNLPSQLNIPSRSEKVSLDSKIKFDECLPRGINRKSSSTNIGSTTSTSPNDVIQGSQADDLPEYKDQEILDKLQQVYPEAGGLQLNKPKSKAKVEGITPETDTPLGIKSMPQTSDPLQQPSTPHGTSVGKDESISSQPDSNNASSGAPSNTNTTQGPLGNVGNVGSAIGGLLGGDKSGTSRDPSKPNADSAGKAPSNVVLNKNPKSNSQPGTPKNPSSNTISNSIKARYAPHTYIDIYKEEDYFPDLKGSTPESTKKGQPSAPPSLKEYISKSSELSKEQKENIDKNLSAITEVLTNEKSTQTLSTALSTKVKGLNDQEIKGIVDSYLELNASMAVGFGFLGSLTSFFQEATSVVTEVYEQVDKAASVFGFDIDGGAIGSVMDIVNKVKSASNTSSISGLLSSLGADFDEFMPITTSILGMLDGSKSKDDLIGSISGSISTLVTPLLKDSSINPVLVDSIVSGVSDVISNGAVMNRDKGDMLNRITSLLSSSGIVPSKAFEIANGLGNVIDGVQDGSLIPSLLGTGVNTLFSSLTNSIDLGPINKALNNINSIIGTIETFMSIPSMLETMNDYDIPLLSQISSILDCADVFTRIKDIVGIVQDPLKYEPQHKGSSLNLPSDLSIDKLKDLLVEKTIGNTSKVGQVINSDVKLQDYLGNLTSNSKGLDSLVNKVTDKNPFFLIPAGSKSYLADGSKLDSSKFLVNNKGDVLVTNKDNICKLEDISLVSSKEVVALDLSSITKAGKGGVITSLSTNASSTYLPEYRSKSYITKALQAGSLEPIAIRDKDNNTSHTVDIGIKNNPELINELTDKSNAIHLKDPTNNEEFIWSEIDPTSIPGYVPEEDIEKDEPRVETPSIKKESRGTVQHTRGTCKATIKELFMMIDRLQGGKENTLTIKTPSEVRSISRPDVEVRENEVLIKDQVLDINSLTYIEVNNKGYKLLSWTKGK